MTEAPLRLGTRGSALALAQAKLVAKALGGAEIVPIKTSGTEAPRGGDKARFVQEIERALLDGEVDLGVHSAKDLPDGAPRGPRDRRRARPRGSRATPTSATSTLWASAPRARGSAPRACAAAPRSSLCGPTWRWSSCAGNVDTRLAARGGRVRRAGAGRGGTAPARPRGGDVLPDRARAS